MKLVIVLNAAPNSGKDTIADYIIKNYDFTKHEFKSLLYQDVADYYNVNLETVIKLNENRYEKNKPQSIFNNLKPRDALIYVAENIIKPKYGFYRYVDDIFNKIKESKDSYFIISDGGSPHEEERIDFYKNEFKIYKIVIEKNDTNYKEDVRTKFKHYDQIIYNNDNLEKLYFNIDKVVSILQVQV